MIVLGLILLIAGVLLAAFIHREGGIICAIVGAILLIAAALSQSNLHID